MRTGETACVGGDGTGELPQSSITSNRPVRTSRASLLILAFAIRFLVQGLGEYVV